MSANSDIPEARNILIKMLHLSSLEIRRYDNDCRREPSLARYVLALWCGTANRQLEGPRLYLSDLRVPKPTQAWIANIERLVFRSGSEAVITGGSELVRVFVGRGSAGV